MAFKFESLKVWQQAIDLAVSVDLATKDFPKEELYVLASQLKRAADSVSLNIAEGSTGQSNAEFSRFLTYSIRSNIEVVGCLHLAIKRSIMHQDTFDAIYKQCEGIHFMLIALKKSLK
ncbi:S23 ribosomal protein [Pseudopedobacter saltans DSM 12145]|uniref:S23 ribosomal protein n=1 Tax=Pseudopedobacter saltans (strain ATCC 51119 / DSM 12145 / JCM 21818 / CCUG 39354 / LMG 10337 / NBRC 100064 / NCIMB 13643) TaxID=762903 RepID=F0S9D1_PSESL|nr:four helix bundle protein [Pseudopedobacter saltans]ADY52481.1 S23 ribosomal protein [Pseudopedobacter saltans DSM 12145]